jgi:hypothetical protein
MASLMPSSNPNRSPSSVGKFSVLVPSGHVNNDMSVLINIVEYVTMWLTNLWKTWRGDNAYSNATAYAIVCAVLPHHDYVLTTEIR